MNLNKVVWAEEGDRVTLSMPISKVDKAARTVSGFATLDNIDQEQDLLHAEASRRAFAEFRGNVREMHMPIAVGKVLSFVEKPYYDPDANKFYNGIYVTVYVSKGAESTWEKVLDGTLTGFSIGGALQDADNEFIPELNKVVRIIKSYKITELSLVDSPMNQLANIFSINKSVTGENVYAGLAVNVKTENIMWCEKDEVAVTTTYEDLSCAKCENKMENIGWVESESDDKPEMVKNAIKKRLNLLSENNHANNTLEGVLIKYSAVTTNNASSYKLTFDEKSLVGAETKGGAEVTEEKVEKAEELDETESSEAVDEGKSEVVEEVEPVDIKKMLTEFTAQIKDNVVEVLKSASDETKTAVDTVANTVEDLKKSFEEKVSELKQNVAKLDERVSAVDGIIGEVSKRVDLVENETAIKKSSDLGGDEEETELKKSKSVWQGAFFSAENLTK